MQRRVLFVLATLSALVLVPPAAAADAPVPTHEVGDKVGFGTTIDLGELADTYILPYIRDYDEADANVTIHAIELDGSVDLWTTMEVVDESATEYTIGTKTALGVQFGFFLDVTSTQFPQAGTHPGDNNTGTCVPLGLPTATERATMDVEFEYLEASTGNSVWTVSNFALAEDRTDSSYDLLATTQLRNVPMLSQSETECEFTITYGDRDLTASAAIDLQLTTAFTPALDLFEFPIADQENWTANATATTGGTIEGTIDIEGLDLEEEQAFLDTLNATFELMGLSVSGLDGFPIILEDVTIRLGPVALLQDGVINDRSMEVGLSLHADEVTKILSDGNAHQVYIISEHTSGFLSPCGWVYSPVDGFVVGFSCILMGQTFDLLENVPADEAEQRIEDTKRDYAVGPAGSNPNALADFFLKPPFLGILFVAAVAIIAAALVMRRRRKPAMAPPGPAMPGPPLAGPPQGPPPGPP